MGVYLAGHAQTLWPENSPEISANPKVRPPSRPGEGDLSSAEEAAVIRWRSSIISVAIEEMTHLALASNLIAAMGGRPHFGRPNFPVAPGYHPAGIIVRLAPFNIDALDHFIFMERPEGSDIADSPAFAANLSYERV